jgi:hypothetical protein
MLTEKNLKEKKKDMKVRDEGRGDIFTLNWGDERDVCSL